ncbi:hypothetical protein [Sinorhizobium meliloti]|uniref:hypothetical protein n=1 Tax=Rhizobium meliloti TaxID=382 RepID=UPI001F2F484E|nr:hypothetical protein [Sinorhizobium meliloti]
MLLIQGQAQKWAESGRVAVNWGTSVRANVGKLVERLMPLARPQLLAFETEGKRHSFSAAGPIVFVRWTTELQTRIAALAAIVRTQDLSYVVQPLAAADHAWATVQFYHPESDFILNSYLCISGDAAWIEWYRRSWREDNPPERHSTNRIRLRDVMPIDFLDGGRGKFVPSAIPEVRLKPYQSRLQALGEAERIYEMITKAAYGMDRSVPNEILAMADRIWFGADRPFRLPAKRWPISKLIWSVGSSSLRLSGRGWRRPFSVSNLATSLPQWCARKNCIGIDLALLDRQTYHLCSIWAALSQRWHAWQEMRDN